MKFRQNSIIIAVALLFRHSEVFMKLSDETIKAIEHSLSHKKPLEIRVEKGNVVLVEINRKVTSKEPCIN